MFPTDLDMRALYYEKVREGESIRRVNEARRLASPPPARPGAGKRVRGPAPLGWLLRMVLRAGAA
jgi:hypothetical protein